MVEKELPSTGILALGLVAATALSLTCASAGVLLIFGSLLYPTTVGLFLGLPYYTYTIFLQPLEMHDSNRWNYFTCDSPLITLFRKYLGMKTIVSKKLQQVDQDDKEARFLFAMFPHGTWSDHRIVLDGLFFEVVPHAADKVRTLVASVLFRLPVVRELCLWTGCVDARRSVAQKVLDNGRSILVLPGGEAEQLNTEFGKEKIYLRQRKGFIKLAMRNGVPVVPVYAFGVSDYYYTSNLGFAPRQWLMKQAAVCIPLTLGFLGFPLCPRPVPTTVVFGDPLVFPLEEKGQPTARELNEAHQQFIQALEKLFDQHKDALGYGDRTLIVE